MKAVIQGDFFGALQIPRAASLILLKTLLAVLLRTSSLLFIFLISLFCQFIFLAFSMLLQLASRSRKNTDIPHKMWETCRAAILKTRSSLGTTGGGGEDSDNDNPDGR